MPKYDYDDDESWNFFPKKEKQGLLFYTIEQYEEGTFRSFWLGFFSCVLLGMIAGATLVWMLGG